MSLKLEDMVFGEYYKIFLDGSDDQYAIIRYDDIADNGKDRDRILGPMISNMDSSPEKFYYKKQGKLYQRGRVTKEATPEEIAWLKASIRADQLVDKQLTGVIPDVYQGRPLDVKLLSYKDIKEGEYYHITDHSHNKAYAIIKTESKDDVHRWTGPTISNMDDYPKLEFEDGTDGDHGAYFGGDGDDEEDQREVRYATEEEIAWLNACIQADELVDKQLTGLIPGVIPTRLFKHTEIVSEVHYHVTYDDDAGDYVIIKTDSQDDTHRWTGPSIVCDQGDLEFQDGTEDEHGAYFGGDKEDDRKVEIRFATGEEIRWLDACIEAGELVERPEKEEVVTTQITPGTITPEIVMKHIVQLVKQSKPKIMEKYITQLSPDMVGKYVKCRIEGKKISEAAVWAEGGDYYLCQDVVNSSKSCENKRGYKHSWCCGDGSPDTLQSVGVTAIEFIAKVPKFKVGDYVLIEKEGFGVNWVNDMDKYNGRIALITKDKDNGTFQLSIDKGSWNWNEGNLKESGVKAIPVKEIVKNEIYVYTGSEGTKDHVFRSENTGESAARCDRYMIAVEKYYSNSGGGLGSGDFRTCTPKEKLHLLACIEAKKYVDPPKEEELPVAIDIDPDVLIEMILNNR